MAGGRPLDPKFDFTKDMEHLGRLTLRLRKHDGSIIPKHFAELAADGCELVYTVLAVSQHKVVATEMLVAKLEALTKQAFTTIKVTPGDKIARGVLDGIAKLLTRGKDEP